MSSSHADQQHDPGYAASAPLVACTWKRNVNVRCNVLCQRANLPAGLRPKITGDFCCSSCRVCIAGKCASCRMENPSPLQSEVSHRVPAKTLTRPPPSRASFHPSAAVLCQRKRPHDKRAPYRQGYRRARTFVKTQKRRTNRPSILINSFTRCQRMPSCVPRRLREFRAAALLTIALLPGLRRTFPRHTFRLWISGHAEHSAAQHISTRGRGINKAPKCRPVSAGECGETSKR